jgi:hypothetical protein
LLNGVVNFFNQLSGSILPEHGNHLFLTEGALFPAL